MNPAPAPAAQKDDSVSQTTDADGDTAMADANKPEVPDFSKMTVAKLQHELRSRGLDHKGLKAVLIARLQAAVDAASSS